MTDEEFVITDVFDHIRDCGLQTFVLQLLKQGHLSLLVFIIILIVSQQVLVLAIVGLATPSSIHIEKLRAIATIATPLTTWMHLVVKLLAVLVFVTFVGFRSVFGVGNF